MNVRYLLIAALALVGLVACGSPPAEEGQPQTAALIKVTPAVDWDLVHNGLVVLYWHEGDLWRSTADGSRREPITQERLLDEWLGGPESDPWWMGGPPPQPAVSPDGRWLVVSIDGRQFAVVDLGGVYQTRHFPATGQTFSWSPDSRHIAYGRDKVSVLDVTTGEQLAGSDRRPGDIEDIVWSPDGQEIAFACCFRPDENQAGQEIGEILRYRLTGDVIEKDGETWRGVASGTPGLCWINGRPILADEAEDRSHCSPGRPFPSAATEDGSLRAELSGYSSETGGFTQLQVTDMTKDEELLRLDLLQQEPPGDLRRVFWLEDGEALLLGSLWPGTPIFRWYLAGGAESAPIVDDGVPFGAVPQWGLEPVP